MDGKYYGSLNKRVTCRNISACVCVLNIVVAERDNNIYYTDLGIEPPDAWVCMTPHPKSNQGFK